MLLAGVRSQVGVVDRTSASQGVPRPMQDSMEVRLNIFAAGPNTGVVVFVWCSFRNRIVQYILVCNIAFQTDGVCESVGSCPPVVPPPKVLRLDPFSTSKINQLEVQDVPKRGYSDSGSFCRLCGEGERLRTILDGRYQVCHCTS